MVVSVAIQSYRDLGAWQQSTTSSVACYRLSKEFPSNEMYAMTSQVRRASVSVAANIAEGHGRETTKLVIQFLRVSQGSLKELETHLILASEVKLVRKEQVEPLLAATDGLGRMLRGLMRSLQAKTDD